MKKLILPQEIFECQFGELTFDEQQIILASRESIKGSYSPYSHFQVGCAIQLCDSTIVRYGSNIENASYSATICAERVLLSHVHAMGKTEQVAKLAVTAKHVDDGDDFVGETPVSPCGVCRQALKEVEDRLQRPIIFLLDCFNDNKIYRVIGIESLLPLGFGPANLKIKNK